VSLFEGNKGLNFELLASVNNKMMKKLIQVFSILFALGLFAACNSLFNSPPDGDSITEIGKYESGDFGTIETETGESINIIPGTIPPNSDGDQAAVTFTIETNVDEPESLGNGGEFNGGLVKFGPEYFNFRWPLQLSLPYEEGVDPNSLTVMHYDYAKEKWVILPKAGMDSEKKVIYFNTLTLGVFGLAELSEDYRNDCYWCDGGIRLRDHNRNYFYTFTVGSVSNPKYDWQESWLPPIGYVVGSTGSRNNSPLADTWGFLVQATYQIWISRTKPGTYWELPVIETYSIPAGATLTEPNVCPQSATTFPDMNLCDPWVDISIPGGGNWLPGRPDGWPVPTTTYGTGDFQVTLNWINNESHATDLDLHLYGPDNMHVYYEYDVSDDGSLKLDRDWWEDYGSATENIFSVKDMPSGNYEIKVKHYSGDPANFNVRIIKFGDIKNYSGRLENEEDEKLIDEFSL